MTKDEALKLALEVLEEGVQGTRPLGVATLEAIATIKEALAQPEQEPKRCSLCNYQHGHATGCANNPVDIAIQALAQPAVTESHKQEPVAWKLVPIKPTDEMLKAMDECSKEGYDERLYAGHAASVYMAAVDVAPTPPQRKPLSDDEIILIVADCASSHQHTDIHFARAIEAKLKEKNT